MKILIKNGRVIDPKSGFDKTSNILIEDDKILKISENIDESADKTIDAEGKIVLPGLIDLHVHFREPGREDQETIIGGSHVAAKGGFTSVCPMPNTTPKIDNQALVRFIKHEGEKGPINVFPVANVSKGSIGEELSEMGELINAGAVAFSDDGLPVKSSILMRRCLEYARMFDVTTMVHEEDMKLTDKGVMHEGVVSTQIGLKGIPRESEDVMVARDVLLSQLTGGKLHVQHLSSKNSVEIIKISKEKGIKVTAETAPHYFALTDEIVREKLSMAKMKPPIREESDRRSIIEALRDGTIDVIATDHAPHLLFEKRQEIEYAPFGIVGLETAVPLIITKLVKEENFSYIDAFSKVTCNAAEIIKVDRGELKEGAFADIVIIDPDKEVEITEEFITSKCKNSPFIGMKLTGAVEYTICNGEVVFQDKK